MKTVTKIRIQHTSYQLSSEPLGKLRSCLGMFTELVPLGISPLLLPHLSPGFQAGLAAQARQSASPAVADGAPTGEQLVTLRARGPGGVLHPGGARPVNGARRADEARSRATESDARRRNGRHGSAERPCVHGSAERSTQLSGASD
jgi:hypothetical protein